MAIGTIAATYVISESDDKEHAACMINVWKISCAICGALAIATSQSAPVQATERGRETAMVTIVVDLTAEGRKLPEPSRERPVIYFPVTAGELDAGDDAPPKQTVQRWLAEALAGQGYFPISPQADRASQLLVFQWGAIDPQIEEMDFRIDEENPLTGQKFWNERELLDLLAGMSANKPMPSWKREKMRSEAVAGRYFVRLLAYDYEAAKKKQKKLLWHARVSTYSDGATLSDVLPTLIKAGGPHFGRATKQPVVVALPVGREVNVELGESSVKEYLPPTGTKEAR